MLNEFKKFAVKGNMLDMAVGLIMGGAFGTIIKSLVDDVLMPPLGLAMGGVDFTNLKMTLKEAVMEGGVEKVPEVAIRYGSFINAVIAFLIVAFALFLMLRGVNKMMAEKEAEPEKPAEPPKQEVLLGEIRDLLKQKN